jgi:hypothetical protein
MTFTAGDLCCVSAACVLIDTNSGESAESWSKIPHVTQISTTQTANTPKLVTSSTAGNETSACGTVTNVGTLAVACHGGTELGRLCINSLHRIRWSADCDNIWNGNEATGTAVADVDAGIHFEALVRITSVPDDFNIAGNTALVRNYGFDVVEWTTLPDCQTAQLG